MAAREIERDQWGTFFDQFSRTHKGWPVTIEVLGDLGAQIEARALPFEGITSESDGENWRFELIAGYKPGDHVSHSIDQPVRVWLSTLGELDSEALEVECADGQKILIRFSTAKVANQIRN